MSPDQGFWRGKRVFVTGHTGFKGAWLCAWLDRLGAKVLGLALPPEDEPNLFALLGLEQRLDHRLGDIRDAPALDGAMSLFRPEIVLHLAAQSLVRRSYREPVETFETNVMGTINLLEAVRRTPSVRAAIVVTSDKCYENLGHHRPYRETDALGGEDPYSASKACAELVTGAWRHSFLSTGIALASARAGNVIGGGDWAVDRLVPDCIQALGAGRAIELRNPAATRPWQHVLAPLSGYLLLAERLYAEGAAYARAWNFGPPPADAIPVAKVVERVIAAWGAPGSWVATAEPGPPEARHLAVDAGLARAELGWSPRLDLATGLAWTVEWYRRQRAGEAAEALVAEQIARFEALPESAP